MLKRRRRFAVKLSGVPAMESLYEELPNFSEVLDDIRKQIALCASSNDPGIAAPVLVGEPGIGKTHFGALAQLLATGFGFVSMSANDRRVDTLRRFVAMEERQAGKSLRTPCFTAATPTR